jgi:hypothetical protein
VSLKPRANLKYFPVTLWQGTPLETIKINGCNMSTDCRLFKLMQNPPGFSKNYVVEIRAPDLEGRAMQKEISSTQNDHRLQSDLGIGLEHLFPVV